MARELLTRPYDGRPPEQAGPDGMHVGPRRAWLCRCLRTSTVPQRSGLAGRVSGRSESEALFGLISSTPSINFDQQLLVLNKDSLQN